MEIKVRRLPGGDYYEVIVSDGRTTMDLGLWNETERKMLASQLRDAADELSPLEDEKCLG